MNDLTTAGKVPSSLLRRLFLLCWFVATVAGAQTSEVDLFRQLSPQHDSDSIEMKTLYLDADALAFFKDNEYDGNITKGYTLPGVRFTPHLVYSPRAELRFELGASALVYDGTNRYPNYAFHDIVTWKGGAYQGGAHMLPYFRAVVRMGAATFVLGDLYGGASHELILPLYKPENLLTTDPEKGFQTQISTQRWKMDAWIDWQSFIFEMDKHQEAFTVGMTQRVHLLRPRRYGWSLDVPLQMTVQHRGGEQDDTDMGVQTLSNGSIGLQLRKTWNHRVLNAAEAELHALGAYQQAGKLWPFNTGSGLWAGAALAQSGRGTLHPHEHGLLERGICAPIRSRLCFRREGQRLPHRCRTTAPQGWFDGPCGAATRVLLRCVPPCTTALLAEKIQVRAQKNRPIVVRNDGAISILGVDHCTCCVS